MYWNRPQKPAEIAEQRLIEAIVSGHFKINSSLPPERDLAEQLGVTRSTLRETLQRLARDGWVDIKHGKSTRVRDYWKEGNLAVLSAIAQDKDHLAPDFITNLLAVRVLLAPTYTRLAIEKEPVLIASFLEGLVKTPDTPLDFTNADWDLHYRFSIASGNPIFTLILNGFRDLYHILGVKYFTSKPARDHSRNFYHDLLECCQRNEANRVEAITRKIMTESISFWLSA